jgi:hypothetical protein
MQAAVVRHRAVLAPLGPRTAYAYHLLRLLCCKRKHIAVRQLGILHRAVNRRVVEVVIAEAPDISETGEEMRPLFVRACFINICAV